MLSLEPGLQFLVPFALAAAGITLAIDAAQQLAGYAKEHGLPEPALLGW